MDVVPFPDMSRLNGVLNVAAHLPDRGPMPDLGRLLVASSRLLLLILFIGPKLYVAQGTFYDDDHSGSTVLHMDLTDAVNIMMWSAYDDTGSPGPAIWHIFPAEVSNKIRDFLRAEGGFSGSGDPIHSQSVCLIPRWLARLETEYEVRPYTIHQKPGEAVFIPAGCAHQVRPQHIDVAISTHRAAHR